MKHIFATTSPSGPDDLNAGSVKNGQGKGLHMSQEYELKGNSAIKLKFYFAFPVIRTERLVTVSVGS